MSEVFKNLNSIDVNDKTDKKGNLTYLSWAWAWAEVKKKYPNATYDIERFGENKQPYLLDQNLGYMVFTKVTIEDLVHEMWLPVINYRNQAIKVGEATMTDINKTIMRCLTKNLAMHGLGLYIYAGEDLPEDEKSSDKSAKEKSKQSKEQASNLPKLTAEQIKSTTDAIKKMHGKHAELCLEELEKSFGVNSIIHIERSKNNLDKIKEFVTNWTP